MISKRDDGARMDADGAVHAACEDGRSTSDDGHVRVGECVALYRGEWWRMAHAAQMLCAGVDVAALFLRMAEHRIVRDDKHRTSREAARDRGAWSSSTVRV